MPLPMAWMYRWRHESLLPRPELSGSENCRGASGGIYHLRMDDALAAPPRPHKESRPRARE